MSVEMPCSIRPDFYPRPPRGGRHGGQRKGGRPDHISIHALREEGDLRHSDRGSKPSGISIHALREEGDQKKQQEIVDKNNFYPRPPRGGRHNAWFITFTYDDISIHALREEGDACGAGATLLAFLFLSTPSARRATPGTDWRWHDMRSFLSTPSARRATHQFPAGEWAGDISIHALREEGDSCGRGKPPNCLHFYPRPPRGGRHAARFPVRGVTIFLSTPSARRATLVCQRFLARAADISIHALREEGDH